MGYSLRRQRKWYRYSGISQCLKKHWPNVKTQNKLPF
jgi:hypothetical protein